MQRFCGYREEGDVHRGFGRSAAYTVLVIVEPVVRRDAEVVDCRSLVGELPDLLVERRDVEQVIDTRLNIQRGIEVGAFVGRRHTITSPHHHITTSPHHHITLIDTAQARVSIHIGHVSINIGRTTRMVMALWHGRH